jgi:hypothetical protein
MYYKLLAMAILIFAVSEVKAQGIAITGGPNGVSGTMALGNNNDNNSPAFSSTAQEGWLRGLSSAWSGMGNYLHSLGVYENLHEQARRQYLQNEYNRIQGRWALKDQIDARKKAAHKDFITMEHERLDRIIRLAELNKRKEEMTKAGLLPKPVKSVFRWKGQTYENYAAFKASPDYQTMLAERAKKDAERRAEEDVQEQRRKEAVELGRKHRRMSSLDWHRLEQRQRALEILGE